MSQERAQTQQNGDNTGMLEAIYENTEMGEKALDQLIPMAEEGLFKAELQRQRNVYHEMASQAELCLTASGATPKGQSAFAKMNTQLGIKMKTMTDKSTRNLAEMLSEGNYQGVLDCHKCETDFPSATPGAKKMLRELEAFQEDNCQRLEQYL